MKKFLVALFVASFLHAQVNAEEVLTGQSAYDVIKGASVLRFTDNEQIPNYVQFVPSEAPSIQEFTAWFRQAFNLADQSTLEIERVDEDELGFSHYRMIQKIDGFKVQYTSLIVHVKAGKVVSFNGKVSNASEIGSFTMSEEDALQHALDYVGASVYFWESVEEDMIKQVKNDPSATYFPKGEMVYFPENLDFSTIELIPAWKFSIGASEPLFEADVFVSAIDGKVLFKNQTLVHIDTNSTAMTSFSGLRSIISDYDQGQFYLQESGRGGGIFTYDMHNRTSNPWTNWNLATILTNDSSYWHDTLRNEYGTDAHWGAEMVYDYYINTHGRNSLDDAGVPLSSYVHYGTNYNNAFFLGSGPLMAYGDGSGSAKPYTCLDVCAHEFSHGVTNETAQLIYQDEYGALNESFSDIFGVAVEYQVKPNSVKNWEMGEDRGSPIRDMKNPKRFNDPDTYQGNFYYTGTADNGGVHTNSGVQNFWFYLLSEGGSGTNDNNDAYNVTGITIQKAEKIAYRNLVHYLWSDAEYADARFYAILAAADLYGGCSPEVVSTTEAWYAVGVGGKHTKTVTSDFQALSPVACSLPFEVEFTNLSNYNANSYLWDFGDGNTSTQKNPTHTYTTSGNFTVKLTATGGFTCSSNSDTETKSSYVQVNPPTDVLVDPYTICEGYPARIRAYASDQAFWFIDSNDVIPVFTGNPYVSQPLTQDTFFYVANGFEYGADSVGLFDNTTGTGGNHTTPGYGLEFDVYEDLTLESVTMYSQAAGYRGIDLVDQQENVILSKLVNFGVGETLVELNWKIEPGSQYRIKVASWVLSADFYRNNGGASYPYEIDGLISINQPIDDDFEPVTNNNFGYYYYFYNWKVKRADCIGSKKKVPVSIDYDPDCIPYLGLDEEESISEVKLYPNPTSGSFNIDFELANDEELSIRIIDSRGAMVYMERDVLFNKGFHTYNIENNSLAKGIYFVQINGQSLNHTQRLVVE